MKFFIPEAKNEEQAEKVYEDIKAFAVQNTGWQIEDAKIFSIHYRHNGKEYNAEVGQMEHFIGDYVIAILESNAYLICTRYRGVIKGEPILVGKHEVLSIKYFD